MGHRDPQASGAFDDAVVADVLQRHGDRVKDYLHALLKRAPRRDYLDELVADYPSRGGKLLRPCLCLAAAVALGADAEEAVPSAASIELMHNALLIHDDIEDDSDLRRGRPTLHALHGVPLALNAGDALGLLSLVPLKDNMARLGPSLAKRVFDETERMAWATAEGQALELGWQRDGLCEVDEEDYLNMVLLKTCWLTTIHPLRVGCLIGGRGRIDPDGLIRLGFFVGAAFQIQDDVLNLDDGALAYGKECGGDLIEGKRTLMVIHALRHVPAAQAQRLRSFMQAARSARRPRDVRWVRGLLQDTGAIEHARQVAAALAGAGLREFDRVFATVPESAERHFLRAMATWVLQRRH